MAYTSEVIDSVYVVRWENPTATDVPLVEREVANAARRATGKLHGLSIVPAATRAPDDETRSAMGRSMSTLLEHLETMHVVIEGTGFTQSILRNVMAGIILVGGKRGRVFVVRDVLEALPELDRQTGTSSLRLSSLLTSHGFLPDRAAG